MAYSDLIGDGQPAAVKADATALPMPVVTQADISDKTSAINTTLLSGKQEGACVIMKETTGGLLVIVIATGSTDVATWVRQDTKAVITPA